LFVIAKAPKIPVLHIYHNQDATLYKATIREDKVYLRGEHIAKFTNKGVFTVKDETKRKKTKYKVLIYLDGKAETAKIPKDKEAILKEAEENPETLQTIPETGESVFEPLTDNDRITVVKRQITKSLGKLKPMETWQFIVIIALLGALLALQFLR
jgi:hypothetical protein